MTRRVKERSGCILAAKGFSFFMSKLTIIPCQREYMGIPRINPSSREATKRAPIPAYSLLSGAVSCLSNSNSNVLFLLTS